MKIELSELDRLRFGVATAKAKIEDGDTVDELLSQAQAIGTELLIVRLPTNHIVLAQELEKKGAFLTDTLVYYQKKKIDNYEIELPDGYVMCDAEIEDAAQVEKVAAESFKGYFGHYHADPYLRQEDCDDVYSSWAKNSCKREALADGAVLIKKGSEIAAFATLKKINIVDFEGVLFGVAPLHQGKGMHLNLMKLSVNWGQRHNLRRLLTSTQINNVTVQKNWCRIGMEPLNSFYTFHLWMNKQS